MQVSDDAILSVENRIEHYRNHTENHNTFIFLINVYHFECYAPKNYRVVTFSGITFCE